MSNFVSRYLGEMERGDRLLIRWLFYALISFIFITIWIYRILMSLLRLLAYGCNKTKELFNNISSVIINASYCLIDDIIFKSIDLLSSILIDSVCLINETCETSLSNSSSQKNLLLDIPKFLLRLGLSLIKLAITFIVVAIEFLNKTAKNITTLGFDLIKFIKAIIYCTINIIEKIITNIANIVADKQCEGFFGNDAERTNRDQLCAIQTMFYGIREAYSFQGGKWIQIDGFINKEYELVKNTLSDGYKSLGDFTKNIFTFYNVEDISENQNIAH